MVEFNWKSFVNGKPFNETVNIVDKKTLSPIFHKSKFSKIGDERYDKLEGTKAYDFYKDKMAPSDSIANNKAKEISTKSVTIPIISWEQDLETYALLPIKKVEQKFDIAFFDPNEKKPNTILMK